MKKTILLINIMLITLLSTTVLGASVGIGGSLGYDFGEVKKGNTYEFSNIYIQPFESQCLNDGYTPKDCPYTIGVEMQYPEYVDLIGIEDTFTSNSWENHHFTVQLNVPKKIKKGEYSFRVCGIAINTSIYDCPSGSCFKTGACDTMTFHVGKIK